MSGARAARSRSRCSRSRRVGACVAARIAGAPQRRPALRVCADPDNLPFSSEDGSGFENRIAELVADELRRPLEYTWWPQRRGFVRKTLERRRCATSSIGVPAGHRDASRRRGRTTGRRYVFVIAARRAARRSRRSTIRALAHAAHRRAARSATTSPTTPPGARAGARAASIDNVVGYHGLRRRRPPSRSAIVDAVARGEVDVARRLGAAGRLLRAARARVPLARRAGAPRRPARCCRSRSTSRWACGAATRRCATQLDDAHRAPRTPTIDAHPRRVRRAARPLGTLAARARHRSGATP